MYILIKSRIPSNPIQILMTSLDSEHSMEKPKMAEDPPTSIWKMIVVASIGAGVQFGWALQLSLLTPYVQLLGVPHAWSSFIWLCGPISGIVVQPIVGYTSDRSKSKFGRRKPFIFSGTVLICLAVLLIGFAADLGHSLGDSLNHKTKPRAVALFVIGFWILDIANNMVQDPSRAFLADLSKHDHKKMRLAQGMFSFFMGLGNIVGYALGSVPALYNILPFTHTKACDVYCANLKSCFLLDIVFLGLIVTCALFAVPEPKNVDTILNEEDPFFKQVKESLKNLGKPMWFLFLVTGLNWIGWFPFVMFNTDWVGKEVYGGTPDGSAIGVKLYDMGVRAGSLGLLLTAATLGVMSLLIDPLSKALRGARRLWGVLNFILAICLACTYPITKAARRFRRHNPPFTPPSPRIKSASLALFAVTGIPQAATFSIPFALASMFSSDSGAGHGLSLGLMNLAICIPQMLVSVVSGPWDSLWGGGNLPAFMLGAVAAAVSGILALTILPPPSSNA